MDEILFAPPKKPWNMMSPKDVPTNKPWEIHHPRNPGMMSSTSGLQPWFLGCELDFLHRIHQKPNLVASLGKWTPNREVPLGVHVFCHKARLELGPQQKLSCSPG